MDPSASPDAGGAADAGSSGGSNGGTNGTSGTSGTGGTNGASNGSDDDAGGGGGTDPRKCPPPAMLGDKAALHGGAVEVITSPATCTISSCHDSDKPAANLNLAGLTDLRTALVDKPACQVPALMMVDGKGGDAALANSWLWQKLTAPINSSNVLEVNTAWGASASCKQQPGQTFGLRMPVGVSTLADDKLAKVRDWICAGAPAP